MKTFACVLFASALALGLAAGSAQAAKKTVKIGRAHV